MLRSLTALDGTVQLNSTERVGVSYNPPMEAAARKRFGDRLRRARQERELAAESVAKHFDVSIKTVYAWESGGGLPDAMRLRSLCRLYGVSADTVLWDTAEEAPGGRKFSAAVVQRISHLDDRQFARLVTTVPARLAELEEDRADPSDQSGETSPGIATGAKIYRFPGPIATA